MENRLIPTAEDQLQDMLIRMCGLDDMARTFMERHTGGTCGCPHCESAGAEFIVDDLLALQWLLDKVGSTIASCMRRGGSDPSEN